MIDSLVHALDQAKAEAFAKSVRADGSHVVVTLHRPPNVDDPRRLALLGDALQTVARERPVYFPMHPRTRQRVEAANIDLGAVRALAPVGSLEMPALKRVAYDTR